MNKLYIKAVEKHMTAKEKRRMKQLRSRIENRDVVIRALEAERAAVERAMYRLDQKAVRLYDRIQANEDRVESWEADLFAIIDVAAERGQVRRRAVGKGAR